MSNRISVSGFVRSLSDFINRVAFGGERDVLVRGRRLAELPEILRALPSLGSDADQFAADIREARAFLTEDQES